MATVIKDNRLTDNASTATHPAEFNFRPPLGDEGHNCKYNELLHDQEKVYLKFANGKIGLLMCVDCEPDINGSPLTPKEREQLADFEHHLQHTFKAFIEVGCILQQIKEHKLFKESHSNFRDYFDSSYEKYFINSPKCPCCQHPDLSDEEKSEIMARMDDVIDAVIEKREK